MGCKVSRAQAPISKNLKPLAIPTGQDYIEYVQKLKKRIEV